MTPAARIAAAIAVLDAIGDGQAPEQALSRWARASRFAGSKDRAAVRDHVFDVLRNWRSDAALGGAETGRGRMIGRLRALGQDVETLFTGEGHAPAPLSYAERSAGRNPEAGGAAWNLPDWLVPLWSGSLGADADAAAHQAMARAPITLRVRGDVAAVQVSLVADGITAAPNPRARAALTLTDGARKLRQARAWAEGLVELQDASSQAVVAWISGAGTALDYCAGGGGKALALADAGWQVTAHDISAARMADIPERAARAGVQIAIDTGPEGQFDLVLCDAPCSGSGAWRRAPQGKWALTAERLTELQALQDSVLDSALRHVAPGGALVFATCSVLRAENEDRVAAFLARHPGWCVAEMQRWPLDALGDGFFAARLMRDTPGATQP
ncbi:MAG: RsmB/NOP family class I SAM-dependent RNA methyltransferase [Pseudomonadota bacterium]